MIGPHIWPTVCSICLARPDQPCIGNNGKPLEEVHQSRTVGEYGTWVVLYDTYYRDRSLKFSVDSTWNRAVRRKHGTR